MTIPPGVYRIRNAKTKTILDLSRGMGFKIHGWRQHDQANQHWFVEHSGEGVVLKSFETGQYVYTTSVQNGSQLLGSSNFTIWNLCQDGNEWTISFPGTNSVVELQGGNEANGTAIQLCDQSGGEAQYQKWLFEKISGRQPQQPHHQLPAQPIHLAQQGYPAQQSFQQIAQQPVSFPISPGTYFLRNVMSGTLVSLYGSTDKDAEIFGYNYSGGNYQKWQLQPTGYNQSITLRNAQSNTYLWFRSQSYVPSVLVQSSLYPQEYIITAANRGFYVSPAQQPNHALSLFHGSVENETKVGRFLTHYDHSKTILSENRMLPGALASA